jgi:hypothetical protein
LSDYRSPLFWIRGFKANFRSIDAAEVSQGSFSGDRHAILRHSACRNLTAAAQYGTLLTLSGSVSPTLHRVNHVTGAVAESRPITGQEAILGGGAYDNQGTLYCIDGFDDQNSDRLFRIDIQTGVGTVVGNTGFNWRRRSISYSDPRGLQVIGDNVIYGMNRTTGQTYSSVNITGPQPWTM